MKFQGVLSARVQLILVVVVCALTLKAGAQLSNPITHDSHVLDEDNKFLQRKSETAADHPVLDEEEIRNTQCPSHLELKWQAEVSSSIYATPVIADINEDGKNEIIVPSFVHYLEVLDGVDGEKHPGWPVFHQSSTHTSPVLADIDNDGLKDILLATYNGEILVFLHTGEEAYAKFVVPRLKIKKDWFAGLDPDHVDRKHPDIHAKIDDSIEENALSTPTNTSVPDNILNLPDEVKTDLPASVAVDVEPHIPEHYPDEFEVQNGTLNGTAAPNVPLVDAAIPGSDLNLTEKALNEYAHLSSEQKEIIRQWDSWFTGLSKANHTFSADELERWNHYRSWKHSHGLDVPGFHPVETEARINATINLRRRLLQEVANEATAEVNDKLDADAAASWEVFDDNAEEEPTPDQYNYDYDEYAESDELWSDEDWTETDHANNENMVDVDSHILCTPAVADIDGDGKNEVIVASSYFFDREYYENPEHSAELPKGIDMGKYIAGAIVVFDGETQAMKWYIHLDLSTENTQFRAYIYSAPTVVDLDGDGKLEIVVGTSVGFIYVINSDGTPREGFPLQMGEIQGQVTVADVNHDGTLEIIAVDTKGNVAVFDSTGKELWERHTGYLIAQGVTVGDVDGDSQLEVVVTTTGGHVWVLDGSTGESHGSFPFRTHGRVMAPALLVDLKPPSAKGRGLHIVVVSFDGYLYVIDGKSGCADAIDIGETSYSMVLADQVDGGDDLDLIVTTMNGNVFCFQTPAKYHPMKAWPSQTQGPNVAFARQSFRGVSFLPSSRVFRDVGTQQFSVQFEIVDTSPADRGASNPYHVTLQLLVPGDRLKVLEKSFDRPGVHSVIIKCPVYPTHATIRIDMFDKHKFHFSDEFSMSFHMHYYRLFKWILALPLLAMLLALTVTRQREAVSEDVSLPSFRQERSA